MVTWILALMFVSDPDPDMISDIHHVFEIEQAKSEQTYLATSTTVRRVKFRSERGANRATFFVFERHTNPIEQITARINGKPLDSSYRSFSFLEDAEFFISGTRVHRLDFSDVAKKGQVAELVVNRRYDSLRYLPTIVIPNMAIGDFKVEFRHPEQVAVDFDIHWARQELPYTIERPEQSVTRLRLNDLEESEHLPFFPFNPIHAWFVPILSDTHGPIDDHTPDHLARWYLTEIDRLEPLSEEQIAKVGSLVEGVTSSRDKARILSEYVRDQVHYIADESDENALIPRSPKLVFERQYGDCKDMAVLLRAMGEACDVAFRLVLVSTDAQVSSRYAKIDQFNHVICQMDDASEHGIFCDVTRPHIPFGYVPDDLEGKPCLVMYRDKSGGFSQIPENPEQSCVTVEIESHVDQADECLAQVTLTGNLAHSMRHVMEESTDIDFENTISNLVNSLFYKISFDYFVPQSPDMHTMRFWAKADLSSYLIQTKRKLYVPQAIFGVLSSELLDRVDPYPVVLPGKIDISLTMHLKHPGFSASADSVTLGYTGQKPGHIHYASELQAKDEASDLVFKFGLGTATWTGPHVADLKTFVRDYFSLKKAMYAFPRGPE